MENVFDSPGFPAFDLDCLPLRLGIEMAKTDENHRKPEKTQENSWRRRRGGNTTKLNQHTNTSRIRHREKGAEEFAFFKTLQIPLFYSAGPKCLVLDIS